MALPQPHYVTLQEVQKKLASEGHRVKPRTLRTWVARGLLPQHESVKGLGRGLGVRVLYPASVLDRARRIADLRKQGIPENAIREQLKAEELDFARGLVKKYADFHAPLSPAAQSLWLKWFERMVERILDWKLTNEEKEERMRFISANHLSEFRLILDTLEYRLRQRGGLDSRLERLLAEVKSEVEAGVQERWPDLTDQFRISVKSH